MTIDGCLHDFPTLARSILPGHMSALDAARKKPLPMANFARPGVGVQALLRQHDHPEDFSGCYLLLDQNQPIYVGISRRVFARLRQHVRGRTHFDASLAYRMAEAERPHGTTRSAAMKDAAFAKFFKDKRAHLERMHVATVKIANPVELYLFEVYAALALGTRTWNTFRTH